MARGSISLPPGRRQTALSDVEMRKAESVFRVLNYTGPIAFEPQAGGRTRFTLRTDEATGQEEGLIIIGPDLYPGQAVANPNSVIDALPTAAHEITHYIRWEEGRELPQGHLDEAMTSLQAICIFKTALSSLQIEQLVSDALVRLLQFAAESVNESCLTAEKE